MTIHEKVKLWEREEGTRLYQDIGLPNDANILDYGCGFGHYSYAASRYLGCENGKVYAVDVNKECLKDVSRVAQEEGLLNICVASGNEDYSLDFADDCLNMIMYYDILHGEGLHRFTLLEEAARALKVGGILSILPFHLSNFRNREGKKKTYTYSKIINEVKEYGFSEILAKPIGVHFEKYHSKYYIDKGGVEFEDLERAQILNFRKM